MAKCDACKGFGWRVFFEIQRCDSCRYDSEDQSKTQSDTEVEQAVLHQLDIGVFGTKLEDKILDAMNMPRSSSVRRAIRKGIRQHFTVPPCFRLPT